MSKTDIYRSFEQWKNGNVLEHGMPRTEYYSEAQLDLVEMGWKYGYDAGLAEQPAQHPEGDVVGPCVCGSWPGGKCLKCPRIEQPVQQSAERGKPKPIGRPHRAVMGDYGAKLVNQRIEAVVDAERKMQAKTAETRADTGVDGGGRQPAQQDIPDLIAGALGVGRGTAYDMMREALAEQQEPVAWRTFDGEGGYEYRSYDMNEQYAKEWEQRNPKHKGWVEPLYKDPTPCQTCEALARTVMMDQTAHDIPPSREWVGLTDEEIDEWTPEIQAVIRVIEDKIKEKNT